MAEIQRTALSSESSRLQQALLPSSFLNKGLVRNKDGRPCTNYEKWALEFINHSQAFMEITKGRPFNPPKTEAQGEPDADSGVYSIDFKLILAQSSQYAIKRWSEQYNDTGTIVWMSSGQSGEKQTGIKMPTALRGQPRERLLSIMAKEDRKACSNRIEKDIWSFANSIAHDKNLLLIYPYVFFNNGGSQPSIEAVLKALSIDYSIIVSLWTHEHYSKQAFFAFFLKGKIAIARVNSNHLEPFDEIPLICSPTFIEYARRYMPLSYEYIDELFDEPLWGDKRAAGSKPETD